MYRNTETRTCKALISTLSLTSALDEVGGYRHALAALPPEKRPGTRCTRGRVGLGDGLNGYGKSLPQTDTTPDYPARS